MDTTEVEFQKALKTLGLDAGRVSMDSVNKAYRELAKKFHPDKNAGAAPEMFVRITDAKNTALQYLKAHKHVSASTEPLKLEMVPGQLEFAGLGRREAKSRDFIVYSTGGKFTRFSIDRRRLPRWMRIESVTRMTREELPVRVAIRVTGPELGDQFECLIPIRIDNRNTGESAEAAVRIELSMKSPEPKQPSMTANFTAGPKPAQASGREQVKTGSPPNAHKAGAHTGSPAYGWHTQDYTIPPPIKIKKQPTPPLQNRPPGKLVRIDPQKATAAVAAATGGLLLFSVIGIANASPTSIPDIEPVQQQATITEQPGELAVAQPVITSPLPASDTPPVITAKVDQAPPVIPKPTTGSKPGTTPPSLKPVKPEPVKPDKKKIVKSWRDIPKVTNRGVWKWPVNVKNQRPQHPYGKPAR